MSNFMIPSNYNMVIDVDDNNIKDLFYAAYSNCHYQEKAPDLYEIADEVTDIVIATGVRSYTYHSSRLSYNELADPHFIEFILRELKFQYTHPVSQIEVCDCQNILIREMCN